MNPEKQENRNKCIRMNKPRTRLSSLTRCCEQNESNRLGKIHKLSDSQNTTAKLSTKYRNRLGTKLEQETRQEQQNETAKGTRLRRI